MFFVLVVRFWYLQVHRGEEVRARRRTTACASSASLPRAGASWTTRARCWPTTAPPTALSIVPPDCHDIPATLAQISEWSGIPLQQVWDKFRQDRFKVKPFEPLLLITDIDFDLVAALNPRFMNGQGLKSWCAPSAATRRRSFLPIFLATWLKPTSRKWPQTARWPWATWWAKQGLELELEKQLRGRRACSIAELYSRPGAWQNPAR